MSALLPLQCLFCNHLNPAGASFCNYCGSQLHLQPCDRCSAHNKRTAKNCYKCGASFTRPAASELESEPTLLENDAPVPTLHDVNLPKDDVPMPKAEAQQVNETASVKRASSTTLSRNLVRGAVAAILLAAIVMSGDYYSERSAEFPKTEGVIPYAPPMSDASTSTGSTPPAPATQPPAASVTTVTTPTLAAGTSGTDKARAPAPPVAAAPLPVRPSPPSVAGVITRQDPPPFKECPDALVALGFCNPGPKREGQ